MSEHTRPLSEDLVVDDESFHPERYEHKFQKASGSRELVLDDEGEWIRYEDLCCLAAFVHGYLHGHCAILDRYGGQEYSAPIRNLMASLEKLT